MPRFAIVVHGLFGGWVDTFSLVRALRGHRVHPGRKLMYRNVWLWSHSIHRSTLGDLAALFDKEISVAHPQPQRISTIMQHLNADQRDSPLEIDIFTHSMGCLLVRRILSGEEQEGEFLKALLRHRNSSSGESQVILRIVNMCPVNRGSTLARYRFMGQFNPLMVLPPIKKSEWMSWWKPFKAKTAAVASVDASVLVNADASAMASAHLEDDTTSRHSALYELHRCLPDYYEGKYHIHSDLLNCSDAKTDTQELQSGIKMDMHDIVAHTDLPGIRLPGFVTKEKNDGVLTVSDQWPIAAHLPHTHVHQVKGQHAAVLWSGKVRQILWDILDSPVHPKEPL